MYKNPFKRYVKLVVAACIATPLMSISQVQAQSSCECNWYGQNLPMCQSQDEGWGWENNQSCIGISTCNSQNGNFGPVGNCGASPTTPVSSAAASSAAAQQPPSACQEMCQWYQDAPRPLCQSNDSGWGWENNQTCIGRNTCEGQSGNGGVVSDCGTPAVSSAQSSSSSTTYIPPTSSSAPSAHDNTITVRMSGVVGDESVSLQVGGFTVKTWTLSASMMDYTVGTDAEGELRVEFTNDSGDRDVQVDYVTVNGTTYQAEDQQDNTGAYDGECGGGSFSEMLHCDGSIGFGNPWNPGAVTSSSSAATSSTPYIPPVTPPNDFFVGNITTRGSVRSDFAQYWDQITPENEGKWGSVEGSRDQYNWGPLDRIYEYARAHNIPVKAHTMVWGSQQPNWISSLSAAEQRAEIEEWIEDYCTRYPDTAMMDVVNEAVSGHAPAEYARSAFGNDWITESFKLARKYCPNTTLIYNDYNFMTWNTDEIMELIRPAVQSGYVDALGMQAHSLYDPKVWSAREIEDKLDKISTLGLPIYISEYDIEATNDQTQLEYMQMHFPVFYNHPNVKGITLWGYVDGATWRTGTGLIQSNGQHRPAMDWLMNYLGR